MTANVSDQDRNVTLRTPFGWVQGDPLVICNDDSPETLRDIAAKLQIKAFYIGPCAMIGGRRFNKVYIHLRTDMSPLEFSTFWRWIAESVMTSTPPFDKFKGVTFV